MGKSKPLCLYSNYGCKTGILQRVHCSMQGHLLSHEYDSKIPSQELRNSFYLVPGKSNLNLQIRNLVGNMTKYSEIS